MVIEKPLEPCRTVTDCFVSVYCHPEGSSQQRSTTSTQPVCLSSCAPCCKGGCVWNTCTTDFISTTSSLETLLSLKGCKLELAQGKARLMLSLLAPRTSSPAPSTLLLLLSASCHYQSIQRKAACWLQGPNQDLPYCHVTALICSYLVCICSFILLFKSINEGYCSPRLPCYVPSPGASATGQFRFQELHLEAILPRLSLPAPRGVIV